MKSIIIVAHPDDEVLGAGAFILGQLNDGNSVRVVIMNGTEIQSRPSMEDDMKRSHEMLGIMDVHTYAYKNLTLQGFVPQMVTDIESELSSFRPDIVVTHFYGDIHPDHKAVFSASEQAVRICQRHKTDFRIKGFYCMDVPGSTEWGHESFVPDIYVGFDKKTMRAKIDALAVYKNVVRESPHPRSKRSLIAHAVATGAAVGIDFAEGLKCVWEIR